VVDGSDAATIQSYRSSQRQGFTSPANGNGGGRNVPAPTVDTRGAATPLAPSDDSIPMGGLAGRISALTGIDPNNPDTPPAGGLLALLLAAQRQR